MIVVPGVMTSFALARKSAGNANSHSTPAETVHPGLFFTQSGEESEPEAAGQFDWSPEKAASGPVSLLVSSADKTLYVYRNGVEIGRAGMPNSNAVSPLNDRVFSALNGLDGEGAVAGCTRPSRGNLAVSADTGNGLRTSKAAAK
jgi:hypothetical protein